MQQQPVVFLRRVLVGMRDKGHKDWGRRCYLEHLDEKEKRNCEKSHMVYSGSLEYVEFKSDSYRHDKARRIA